ncbi:hypothetical protein Taro_052745 [Colocasia esculenta]|uniref:Uncharacterized protein n=1 Tax=Colocasia esculenta TaxID=4460 RepID=A0A843XKJ0_COLES|nr:hypothetical protein [Colocasia esculenta]
MDEAPRFPSFGVSHCLNQEETMDEAPRFPSFRAKCRGGSSPGIHGYLRAIREEGLRGFTREVKEDGYLN